MTERPDPHAFPPHDRTRHGLASARSFARP